MKLGNSIILACLVPYDSGQEFINGPELLLRKEDFTKLIEYFKKHEKWTYYYFHEIADYSLTHDDLLDVLNYRCRIWHQNNIDFDIQFWSPRTDIIEQYSKNGTCQVLIASDRDCNMDSHYYLLDDHKVHRENYDTILGSDDLLNISNKNANIGILNPEKFDYKIGEKMAQDILLNLDDFPFQ